MGYQLLGVLSLPGAMDVFLCKKSQLIDPLIIVDPCFNHELFQKGFRCHCESEARSRSRSEGPGGPSVISKGALERVWNDDDRFSRTEI